MYRRGDRIMTVAITRQKMRYLRARGPPIMAEILRFPRHHVSRPTLRKRRKKVVRGDRAVGNVFDLRSERPRGLSFSPPDAAHGGRINAEQRRHFSVGQVSQAHPIDHLHAHELVSYACLCQARYEYGDMESDLGSAQSPTMSAKRAHRKKTVSAINPDRRSPTKFRAWRKHSSMTQQEIAELLNVDPSMISRVESGESPYDRAYLEGFAQAYGCEPWQLLIQDPGDPAWLYKFFLGLPDEDRKELFKIATRQ